MGKVNGGLENMAKLVISMEYDDNDPVDHSTSLSIRLPWDAGKDAYLEAYAGFLRALTFSVGELVDVQDEEPVCLLPHVGVDDAEII